MRVEQEETKISLQKIKDRLHSSLSVLKAFPECVLLDYPCHLNIGDHAIGIGEALFLNSVAGTKIQYLASIDTFSEHRMKAHGKDAPIFFHGGGNLGDLWPRYQRFREQIISRYTDRPIVVFPQTIYFRNPDNLSKAAMIFNRHPDLTIFTREQQSYELALKYFSKCKVFKAPDMAFQLMDISEIPLKPEQTDDILYLSRQDLESPGVFAFENLESSNIHIEDWGFYRYKFLYGLVLTHKERLQRFLPDAFILLRSLWQKLSISPSLLISLDAWKRHHKLSEKIAIPYRSDMLRNSLSVVYAGMYQLSRYRFVITNRLHGHIICLLLGIPHILLPNSYYKNESFYNSWTAQIPSCRFIKDPRQINQAMSGFANL